MGKEIIRQGDPTSHGGKVIEGSLTDICFDKPIAYMGHQTYCPLCKGNFPIVEGAMTTSFYGNGVALAGMRTACGATLIPTQFTDTVEWGAGSQSTPTSGANQAGTSPLMSVESATDHAGSAPASPVATSAAPNAYQYDLVFLVQDQDTAQPLASTPYKITLDDGAEILGTTDPNGFTEKIYSDRPQTATIEVPYYDHCHSDAEHGHCACDC